MPLSDRAGFEGAAAAIGQVTPWHLSLVFRSHLDYGGEVDHGGLIARQMTSDGWALSTSAGALPAVLALCPPGVRVAAWHKGERVTRSRYPLSAWEPVIYHGGRQLPVKARADSIVYGVTRYPPGHVIGAKPAVVCRWIFGLLGAGPGDILDDLYPGSGAVSRAWAAYTEASRSDTVDASRASSRYG